MTRGVRREREKCPEAQRLMTHPGVGRLTALTFPQIIGRADRLLREQRLRLPIGNPQPGRKSYDQTLWPDPRQ